MNAAHTPHTRQSLIRLIHVAKRDLALDDETYRAMLVAATGQASSANLSVPQLERVLAHMKKSGFTVKHKARADRPRYSPHTAGTLSRPIHQDAQSRKIRALWLSLHEMGAVRDASEAALGAYVKRITRIDSLRWLDADQASHVIETLKQWQARIRHNPTHKTFVQQVHP